MRQRQRKFAGTVILLVFLTFYAAIASLIGVAVLPAASGLSSFLFYAIAGLVWTIPAGALISWMQKPDRAPDRAI